MDDDGAVRGRGSRAGDLAGNPPVHLRGSAKADRKTKNLISRLEPGDVAVIAHSDIDEVSGRALVGARPKIVINADRSITGRYRCPGPGILLDSGIPVLDGVGSHLIDAIADGDAIEVVGDHVYREGELIGRRSSRLTRFAESAISIASRTTMSPTAPGPSSSTVPREIAPPNTTLNMPVVNTPCRKAPRCPANPDCEWPPSMSSTNPASANPDVRRRKDPVRRSWSSSTPEHSRSRMGAVMVPTATTRPAGNATGLRR
jgi:hypothetical protein